MIWGHRWTFVYAASGMIGGLLASEPLCGLAGMMVGLVIGDVIDHARGHDA